MKAELLLRAILPDVLIDNFDTVDFNRSSDRFDIFLDEYITVGRFLMRRTKQSRRIARRKAARNRQERNEIGKWEPERMNNGETLPQILNRNKYIILKHRSK